MGHFEIVMIYLEWPKIERQRIKILKDISILFSLQKGKTLLEVEEYHSYRRLVSKKALKPT